MCLAGKTLPTEKRSPLKDVISALLPEHAPGGHEQQGLRPTVVVGVPELLGEPRFEVLVVVPMTTDRDKE